jgi:hypothetical protein
MRRENLFSVTVMVLPFVCFWALTGCPSSSGNGGGSGIVDAGEVQYGVISGSVVVIDRAGTRVGDKSGVRVSVEQQGISAVSNTDGGWELTGVAGGSLTLVWEKPDFGISKKVGVRFSGGNLGGIKGWVVEHPLHSVDRLADSTAGAELYFVGTVRADSAIPSGAIRFFVGTDPQVSSDPRTYVATMKGFFVDENLSDPHDGLQRDAASLQLSFRIPLDPDIRRRLGPGAVLYVVAYADAALSLSYPDPDTGGEIFTTLNPKPSPVLRTVIP